MIADNLVSLCEHLEDQLRSELEKQGHVATGRLRDSIRVVAIENVTGVTIEGYASSVAKYVDWGRKSGGKRVPIDALLRWIEVKGMASGKEAASLAWAIQYSIWKNGIPTDRDMSKTAFVTRTLFGNRGRITNELREAANTNYHSVITNMIRDIKDRYYVG